MTANARFRMSDDPERVDPKGTLDTVPPPDGSSDAYSAPTRVGTLPEQVLEAMRLRENDALLEKRTKSGMRAAAVAPRVAPVPAPLPRYRPVARAVPPPLPVKPPSAAAVLAPFVPTPEPMQIASPAAVASPAAARESRALVRSALIVAMLVALGALVAAAISLAGH